MKGECKCLPGSKYVCMVCLSQGKIFINLVTKHQDIQHILVMYFILLIVMDILSRIRASELRIGRLLAPQCLRVLDGQDYNNMPAAYLGLKYAKVFALFYWFPVTLGQVVY